MNERALLLPSLSFRKGTRRRLRLSEIKIKELRGLGKEWRGIKRKLGTRDQMESGGGIHATWSLSFGM